MISYFVSSSKAFYTDPTPLTLWESRTSEDNGVYFLAYLLRTDSWTHCIGLNNHYNYFLDFKCIDIEAESREEAIKKYEKILLIEKLSK